MNHLVEISPELIRLAIIALLAWFAWDMRSILKSNQRKHELSIAGKWEDLDEHFKSVNKPRRPFVWLHRRYLLPGNNTAQHSLFLFNQGRLEEALGKTDEAIRQVNRKPKIFRFIHRDATFTTLCGAFEARILILTALGRYEEASETAHQLQRVAGRGGRFSGATVLLNYHCGHIDEALAQARVVPPENKQYDAMRGITVKALCMKGRLDEALQEAIYEPSDASKFYSPEGMALVGSTPEGAKLIKLKNEKLAGIFKPARLLKLAHVYIAREEFANADLMLDEAEKTLGPEPAVQTSYCRYRSCSLAGQGKAAEAENYITRLRGIAQKLGKRSALWESHFSAGQSYLYLGRHSEAIGEFTKAQEFALHPLDKHVTNYWLARTQEAAGNRREAAAYYQAVAADAIPSWMRAKAAEALAR